MASSGAEHTDVQTVGIFFVTIVALVLVRRCYRPMIMTRAHSTLTPEAQPKSFKLPPAVVTPEESTQPLPVWFSILRCLPQPFPILAEDLSTPVKRQHQLVPEADWSPPTTITSFESTTSGETVSSVTTSVCAVTLERNVPRLAFDLLRIRATKDGVFKDDDAIPRSLEMCGLALARGEPLLVVYDFEYGRLPPLLLGRKLASDCVVWADTHAQQWDSRVQGLAIVLTNALFRNFLNVLNKVLQPPQPNRYCADMAEAMDFLATIRKPQSYVKASYKRSQSKAG